MISHDKAKRLGARIAARLNALGHTMPCNHGLQALAAAEDFPDWNRMKAAIQRPHSRARGADAVPDDIPEYDPERTSIPVSRRCTASRIGATWHFDAVAASLVRTRLVLPETFTMHGRRPRPI